MPARIAAYPSAVNRYAIGLAAVAFSALGAVLVAGFVASFLWPPEGTVANVRRVAVGSKATFDYLNTPQLMAVTNTGRVVNVTRGDAYSPDVDYLARFWMVHVPGTETFLALNWKDPGGCSIPWRPDFEFTDPATGVPKKGWFRDPCRGSTYDLQGHRVFGPSPRDLDRYEVSLSGSIVYVKVGDGTLINGKPSQNSGTLSPY